MSYAIDLFLNERRGKELSNGFNFNIIALLVLKIGRRRSRGLITSRLKNHKICLKGSINAIQKRSGRIRPIKLHTKFHVDRSKNE